MPSQNPFVKTDVEVTETNARIHSFIPNGSQTENESAEHANLDNGPHDYTTTHGVILSSLADAGEAAGLSEDLINQLTHIFAWDIDFETNLHVGDEFIVLYESNGVDEEHIVAAEFVTDGRVLTAVRYEDSEGNVNYYTPEGKAMRKAFLSTPVDYARITSHFDAHRRHPILNRIRAHKGVDYAARTGTPVKATGDGTIAFIGRKGGYGQVVIIQHGERFETLYAHLSGFGRNIIEGDTISQGDIIGYVGQTGLATGPHLHYEFRVDGMHRNPESISSGSRNEMALDNGSIHNFKEQTRIAVAELYSAKAKSLFAKNQSTSR
jgi:murein DD-endopeptidase MepM/ murein hydrolase activator NlpD